MIECDRTVSEFQRNVRIDSTNHLGAVARYGAVCEFDDERTLSKFDQSYDNLRAISRNRRARDDDVAVGEDTAGGRAVGISR